MAVRETGTGGARCETCAAGRPLGRWSKDGTYQTAQSLERSVFSKLGKESVREFRWAKVSWRCCQKHKLGMMAGEELACSRQI